MLTPQRNTSYTHRNLLMDLYYSPTIKAYVSAAQRKVAETNVSREFILADKPSPYYIPMGGSNETGAIGFVNAAFEQAIQFPAFRFSEDDGVDFALIESIIPDESSLENSTFDLNTLAALRAPSCVNPD